MRRRKIITTNLGDLIVALIDEVTRIIRDPSVIYIVVSFILSDLLAHHQAHAPQRRENTNLFG
jgi:hypothetical protein